MANYGRWCGRSGIILDLDYHFGYLPIIPYMVLVHLHLPPVDKVSNIYHVLSAQYLWARPVSGEADLPGVRVHPKFGQPLPRLT